MKKPRLKKYLIKSCVIAFLVAVIIFFVLINLKDLLLYEEYIKDLFSFLFLF